MIFKVSVSRYGGVEFKKENTSIKGAGEAAYEITGTNSQSGFILPTSILKGKFTPQKIIYRG